MTELISIKNDNGKQTVSARELWEKLEVKADFPTWFKRMCEYGFEENIDYCSFLKNVERETGGSVRKEYAISLDMAKEIN